MKDFLVALQKGWWKYVAFWSEREAPEALGFLRLTFGLCLIANILEELFNTGVIDLYVDPAYGGVFTDRTSSPLSLYHWLPSTPEVAYSLVVLQLFAAIGLTLGAFTRLSALIALILQISLVDRMSMFRFDADIVFRVFLFICFIAPMGAAFSVDARWRGKGRKDVPRWARRLFIAQLTILYVRTGLIKFGSTWSFIDGWSALYYSLNLPGLARFPGGWAASLYPLTQIGTFIARWWETTFFLVPLCLYWRRPPKRPGRLRALVTRVDLRLPYALIGILLHASLVVVMNLGLFPFVMLSLYPSFLEPEEVRWGLEKFRKRRFMRIGHKFLSL